MHKTLMVVMAIFFFSSSQAQLITVKQILESVDSQIVKITVEELEEKIETDSSYYLIDVRTEAEYLAGHIKNAIWLPRGFLEFKIQKITDNPDSEIIIYCKRGGRSALATYSLTGMGFKKVLNLEGGFEEWILNGNSIYNQHGEIEVINFEKSESD